MPCDLEGCYIMHVLAPYCLFDNVGDLTTGGRGLQVTIGVRHGDGQRDVTEPRGGDEVLSRLLIHTLSRGVVRGEPRLTAWRA